MLVYCYVMHPCSLSTMVEARREFDNEASRVHASAGVTWDAASYALQSLLSRAVTPDAMSDSGYSSRKRKISQSSMVIKAGRAVESLKQCSVDVETVSKWNWMPLAPSDEGIVAAAKEKHEIQRQATALASQLEVKMVELAEARATINSLTVS